MCLLQRIARSNGNPQRTIAALRLLNAHLTQTLRQYRTLSTGEPGTKDVAAQVGDELSEPGCKSTPVLQELS